jgi:uncharacterized protein
VIRIEIVYARPQRSVCKSLTLSPGASIADALQLAGLQEGFDVAAATVGIFGQVANRDRTLQDGDRIEIYRPLLEEPKLARRLRASRKASKSDRS